MGPKPWARLQWGLLRGKWGDLYTIHQELPMRVERAGYHCFEIEKKFWKRENAQLKPGLQCAGLGEIGSKSKEVDKDNCRAFLDIERTTETD
jgi:hypothetical protein